MQLSTADETRYVTDVSGVDADNDRITISTVAPGQPAPPGIGVVQTYSFVIAKPHSLVTSGEVTFTRTVSVA